MLKNNSVAGIKFAHLKFYRYLLNTTASIRKVESVYEEHIRSD